MKSLLAIAATAALGVSLISCDPKIDNRWETPGFVTVKDGNFMIGDSVYEFSGANFWYGAILASEGQGGDRQRLLAELDTLKSLGIDNLRILVGGDGREGIPSHIMPVLQSEPGVYNDTILDGLDFLMSELEKRGMYAVLYLNNAWEWSGGYGAYLEWAGEGECPLPSDSYDDYCNHVAKFIHNDSAKNMALRHVKHIVGRSNRYTDKPYSESPAVMSWQICNEPRPFGKTPEDKAAFKEWQLATARAIKEIDPNHMVSTGSEGKYGCAVDIDLWKEISADSLIDYANIHLWPYNWQMISKETVADSVEAAIRDSYAYIKPHSDIMKEVGKPLVLEEFGYPRDGFKFAKGTPTTGRDKFYEFVYSLVVDSAMLQGVNFWGWGGLAEPAHETWQPYDQYTGDPAQEAQGLNSVYAADESTIEIIKRNSKRIRQ